eukprot:TRINITY_DN975_c0_g1_i1.p2 TRINITY_DN975_c0_g1~~TRINITY_DN975_c0_g1_i1.p2  ORF type:complete len:127 (+),score=41.99 TRINITY_DN975_c0_g1_i1:54-434(+)
MDIVNDDVGALVFFFVRRRPPRSTLSSSSAASDVYKRQSLNMSKSISKEDLEELKSAFEAYDVNKDGSISLDEFKQCMNKLGITISEEAAKDFIKSMDEDGDGKIQWKEFLNKKEKELQEEKNPFY